MHIKNAKVFTEDLTFAAQDLWIKDGVIAAEADCNPDEEEIDAASCYVIPGLIDLHFHGCMGYDFCDGTMEAIEKIADYEASIGVTTIAPATMTLAPEELEHVLAVGAEFAEKEHSGANFAGINMEGPFISREKKGAQDPQYITPCNAEMFHRFQKAAKGRVKYIGLAPEEGDFKTFIREVKDETSVALAHTDADYDTTMAAFEAGANHAVHLYNAMPPFHHRKPGVIGAVADSPDVMAELICDGVHIHPAVVRTTFRMLGADRIIFISDSMRATGLSDGRYKLGGLDVDVRGNHATLVSDGALAGSATNLMDCVRTAVKKMRIPLETAVACATINPARSLGIDDTYGSIAPGKAADLVILDQELNLVRVIKQ